jgi:hypothetical protein
MSSSKQPLRQSGIYRNLPTFDPDIKGLKAIVCGATGIPGFNTIRSLLDTPDRWSTIYALSRSPLSEDLLAFLTDEQRSHIQHVSIDFGSSGQDIAKSLKDAGVKADYVFSYLSPKNGESAMHPSATDDLVKSNIPPFKNFLGSYPWLASGQSASSSRQVARITACIWDAFALPSLNRIHSQRAWAQTSTTTKKRSSCNSATSIPRRTGTL